MNKRVSIIIPNYNGRHLMEKHLPAVIGMLRPWDELVFVDDCSTDDSVEWLTKKFNAPREKVTPDFDLYIGKWQKGDNEGIVLIIHNHKNIRFAANCNRGVLQSSHPYVFLLNTDVAPEKDVLTYLLPHFDDESVFGVGCLEYEQSDHGKITGGKNKLWFERGMFIHSRADDFDTGDTAWVSGGSGIFDKSKWLTLGGFDLDYAPAYWEDVDLSYRARKKGWQVLFESRAIVYHNHESTNQTAFGQKKIENMSWRNAKKFIWKNGNLLQKFLYLAWQPYWILKRKSL